MGLRQALSPSRPVPRHGNPDRHLARRGAGAPRRRAPGRRLAARWRPHVRRRRALGSNEAQDSAAGRDAQQSRLLQRLGAPDPHGEAARHAARARAHRHGPGRSGSGLREAGAIDGLVCGRSDRAPGRDRRGPEAGDQAGAGGPARARRHDHSETMIRTAALFFALLLWQSAFAQVAAAKLEGPERQARLLEGAGREGSVTVYSSMAERDLRRLAAEFERRYSLKVNLWRAGKDKILQRVLAEARAGRREVDVVHNPSPEMEALHREKLLQAVNSPLLAE